jgi:cobalamin biosynthesis protein CobD/CbiB
MSGIGSGSGLQVGAVSRRLKFIAAGLAVGALLIVITLVFFAFAGYLALLPRLEPWEAALSVGGVALVIAALCLGLAARSLGKTASQVETAVKASALMTMAPTALRLASRNVRLTASLAGLVGVLIVLRRAFRSTPNRDA